jgi:hypothetical protein
MSLILLYIDWPIIQQLLTNGTVLQHNLMFLRQCQPNQIYKTGRNATYASGRPIAVVLSARGVGFVGNRASGECHLDIDLNALRGT